MFHHVLLVGVKILFTLAAFAVLGPFIRRKATLLSDMDRYDAERLGGRGRGGA